MSNTFATPASVRSALAGLTHLQPQQLRERVGGVMVVTSDQLQANWQPRSAKASLQLLRALPPASIAEAQRRVAQAFHDPETATTIYVADRIAAGSERGVILHETVHRHGRAALGAGVWDHLVARARAWAQWDQHTIERSVHDRAIARAQASTGDAGEELVAYAVEEAVAMGVRPGAEGLEGGAEQWLAAVVASLRQVGEKLLGNDLDDLTPQDLVDLAYALAQLDVPERAQQLRAEVERLGGSIDPPSAQPTWYSALAREIEVLSDQRMPAAGWIGAINAAVNRGVVRQAEVEWSGIEEWLLLQKGRLSKDDVLAQLSRDGVQIKEVVYSGEFDGDEEESEARRLQRERNQSNVALTALGYTLQQEEGRYELRRVRGTTTSYYLTDESEDAVFEGPDGAAPDASANEHARLVVALEAEMAAKGLRVMESPERSSPLYDDYALPGGKNYAEVLLTLPTASADRFVVLGQGPYVPLRDRKTGQDVMHGTWGQMMDEAVRRNAAEAGAGEVYTSTHWHVPNVILHLRMNERPTIDGHRVLFIEEIQSDWAQDGRRSGFGSKDQLREQFAAWAIAAGRASEYAREHFVEQHFDKPGSSYYGQFLSEAKVSRNPAPNGPFVETTDSWVALAVKRAIRWAVDRNCSHVAFASGAQSADRYELSKFVSRISYEASTGRLRAFGYGNETVLREDGVKPEGIGSYIGQELASKLLASKPDGSWLRLEGLDVKVGGEGMRAFYDEVLPAVTNKLLKRLDGGRVTTLEFTQRMSFDSREIDRHVARHGHRPEEGNISFMQLGFEITPTLRALARQGLPLFSVPPARQHDAGLEGPR